MLAATASMPISRRLPLGQAGAGDLQVAHFGDGGPQDTGEAGVAASQVDTGYPSGLVRNRAEMQIDRFARDPMEGFGAVACRPDPFDLGPLVIVDRDCAGWPQRDSGLFGEFDLGTASERQNHEVGREAPVVAPNPCHGATGTGDAFDFESGLDVDTHRSHVVGHELRHVRIKGSFQNRRHHGHNGRVDPQMVKGLSDFEPYVPTADDDRALDSGCDERSQPGGIVEGAQHVDAIEVHALNGRADGGSARLRTATGRMPPSPRRSGFGRPHGEPSRSMLVTWW